MPRSPSAPGTRRRARRQFQARVFLDHDAEDTQTIIFPCSSGKYDDDMDIPEQDEDSDNDDDQTLQQSTAGSSNVTTSSTASSSNKGLTPPIDSSGAAGTADVRIDVTIFLFTI